VTFDTLHNLAGKHSFGQDAQSIFHNAISKSIAVAVFVSITIGSQAQVMLTVFCTAVVVLVISVVIG